MEVSFNETGKSGEKGKGGGKFQRFKVVHYLEMATGEDGDCLR